MVTYKIKNGHSIELSFNRGTITGPVSEERYQALIKENPNYESEFELIEDEAPKKKVDKHVADKQN